MSPGTTPIPSAATPDNSLRHAVAAGGLRWRLRCEGEGPDLLLLHGTASSLDSWRACSALLRQRYRVWTPDLPGHGETSGWPDGRANLPRMTHALAALLRGQGCRPALVAGHSAGAALMFQLALDAAIAPRAMLAVNGAALPLQGLAGLVFPPMAKLMALSPWLPRYVARRAAEPRALARLIASTGSSLDAEGIAHYRQLMSSDAHINGALAMMAGWQLDALVAKLPQLHRPVWLAAGSADRTVPPSQAVTLAGMLPMASLHPLPGLGHLAHEEAPGAVAGLLDAMWTVVNEIPSSDAPQQDAPQHIVNLY